MVNGKWEKHGPQVRSAARFVLWLQSVSFWRTFQHLCAHGKKANKWANFQHNDNEANRVKEGPRALSLLYRATQVPQPGAEPEIGTEGMHWTIREVQTHSRALWISLLTGINIRALSGRDHYQVDAVLGDFENPLDLAREEDPPKLSDGSPALALYQAICRKVGYKPRFYNLEEEPDQDGPELARSVDEQEDRSSQLGTQGNPDRRDLTSAKILCDFMPWRTVSLGIVGVLLGLLLEHATSTASGVAHQLI